MAGNGKQLECRIVLTHGHRADLKTELGMYCPVTDRYVPLGAYGLQKVVQFRNGRAEVIEDIDEAVRGLKERILKEGHLLTFSDRRGPR